MKKRVSILISGVFLFAIVINGQCPDRDSLWKRLNFLRETKQLSLDEKLKELLHDDTLLVRCSYKKDSVYSFLLMRIGMIYYLRSDFLRAINYIQKAIDFNSANTTNGSVNHKENISNYFYLSIVYDSLNNVPKKIKALDDCIDLAIGLKASSDISCVRALYLKVEYLYNIGDYYNCINVAEICENAARAYGATGTPYDYLVAKSITSSCLGWHVLALLDLHNFQAAEELLTNKIDEYKEAGLENYLGLIYGQLAQVQLHKSNFDKALFYFDQELSCEHKLKNDFSYSSTLMNIGEEIYFKHLKDYNKTLTCYSKALEYIRRSKDLKATGSVDVLYIFGSIANVYIEKGNFDTAFAYFQRAFDQLGPGINETNFLSASVGKLNAYKKIFYLSGLLIDKGDAFRKMYDASGNDSALKRSINIYKIADEFLDSVKVGLSDLKSKLFWRSDARHLYENAISACYLKKDFENAFYFFEKSRAVLLNDQLNEQKWMGEADIMKETQLEKKTLKLERNLATTETTSARYPDLENELFSSRESLKDLQETIQTNNPLYYQNFVEKKFISIRDVQEIILKDRQALFEWFNGDSAVYILGVTAGKCSLKSINKKNFDSLSSSLSLYISDPNLLNENLQKYLSAAHDLYQLIFQDIDVPGGRIIISPDGKYLPVEALVTSLRPVTYFLEDHAVSYTYSARYLLNTFNASSSAYHETFMGIAPLKFAGLPDLKGSDQSLNKVESYFNNATSYIGNNASRNNFLNEFYKYRIIQLYTHATDSGSAGEPMIYFSDSALNLSDLLPEKKPATALIVLSACQTASGKVYSGEGVFSFNRSFAALGIPSSVSNLWRADDRSSYRITELFYQYLAGGMPVDVALQEAKKEFIKTSTLREYQLPYYWAAPILVGKTDKISIQKKRSWVGIAGIALLVSIVAGGWIVRRKKILRDQSHL